jgi:hypothetical protein
MQSDEYDAARVNERKSLLEPTGHDIDPNAA